MLELMLIIALQIAVAGALLVVAAGYFTIMLAVTVWGIGKYLGELSRHSVGFVALKYRQAMRSSSQPYTSA
jgi:hypothetical protein